MKTSQFVLASRPLGLPLADNLKMEKSILNDLQNNEVLLKSWHISVDTHMRGRMNSVKSYATSWETDRPAMAEALAGVL